MHKRIVKAIELALTQDRDPGLGGLFDEGLLKIFIGTKETDAFWSMMIVPKQGFEHLIPHIEAIGLDIGRFYGESLGVDKGSNYIMFS